MEVKKGPSLALGTLVHSIFSFEPSEAPVGDPSAVSLGQEF